MNELNLRNYIDNDKWKGGLCYLVKREKDELFNGQYSGGVYTMLLTHGSSLDWLSQNTTDDWTTFEGITLYVFRSKRDALMFKLVWG